MKRKKGYGTRKGGAPRRIGSLVNEKQKITGEKGTGWWSRDPELTCQPHEGSPKISMACKEFICLDSWILVVYDIVSECQPPWTLVWNVSVPSSCHLRSARPRIKVNCHVARMKRAKNCSVLEMRAVFKKNADTSLKEFSSSLFNAGAVQNLDQCRFETRGYRMTNRRRSKVIP